MRQLSFAMEPGLALSSAAPVRPATGRGSLTEMIVSEDSAVQPMHLLPLLAQCDAHQRWLMWLSPLRVLNKQWLESLGLGQSPVIHLDLCEDTQMALCSRVLSAGNSHLIVEWQGELSSSNRQQLRQLASHSGSHVILIQRLP